MLAPKILSVGIVLTWLLSSIPHLGIAQNTPAKSTAKAPKGTAIKELPAGTGAGLNLEVFLLGTTIPTGIPKVEADQLPQKRARVPKAVLADYLKNFLVPQEQGFYQRLSGFLQVKESRSYVFTLRNSHIASLKIDGKTILELTSADGVKDKDAEVYLDAGYHKILVEHAGGPKSYREVTLWWNNTPSGQAEYIADANFFALPDNGTTSTGKAQIEVAGLKIRPGDTAPLDDLHPSTAVQFLHKTGLTPAVGGLDFNSKGDLYVSTWDSLGQVFVLKNAVSGDTNKITVKRIATGLAEPLGLKVVADKVYVLQKQELTELVDLDGDEVTDEYRTICNAWGVTGNFHEFAFGLAYQDGFFYAALAIGIMPGGKSMNPQNKDRGKVIKISPDGRYEVVARGLRTPNTIGVGVDRELFVADNQGDWLPACKLMHIKKGAFYGNNSVEPEKYGKDAMTQPVAWFPQNEIGNSTSQPALLNWGPYKNQMVVGDVHYGGLQRVFVEKVNGDYQGAAFRFTQGLEGGTNRVILGPDDALYIGMVGSNGNWGQYGKKWYGLQKLTYTAKPVFDMVSMSARDNGFEITFTEPLKTGLGQKAEDYEIMQWQYVPTMSYGGPKVNETTLPITHVVVSTDRKKVFLGVSGLKAGHVVYLHANYDRVQSAEGRKLWTTEAWYTLNAIPELSGPPAPVVAIKAQKKASDTKQVTTTTKAPEKATPTLNGLALVDQSGCRGCHANDKMGLGPSFSAIAKKYRGEKAAQNRLTEKVLNGGNGVWGEQAMPTHQHIGKDKVAAMVKWVLTLP